MINYEAEIYNIAKHLNLKILIDYKSHINYDASLEENLLNLLKLEKDIRNRNFIKRRIKQAGFPILKTIDTFEFDSKRLPHLKKDIVMNLLECDFIKNKSNICAIGPSGVGYVKIIDM